MISIIIPYYNRPEKIKRCLNSVLNQTYQDFEILVVDDHSTIPLALDTDSRIKIFRNHTNLGPGLSRNVGLENAIGQYIAFLDSDDYWDSCFLQKCTEQFKKSDTNIGMVFTNTLSVTKNGSSPKRKWNNPTETILPNILINNRPWATSSCLWKGDLVKGVKWIDSRNWEDYAFDVSVALKCNNVSQIDEFLVYYDVEGNDKLSNQKSEIAIINWNISLVYISQSLFQSEFCMHLRIRKSITILLINHIILNLQAKINDEKLIKRTIAEFKKWNGLNLSLYIKLLSFIPVNLQLRALRHLKSRIGN